MRVSLEVAICTFNRAADLDRCLAALAEQASAEADWRVVVIDNNCTDATPAVVARHAAEGRIPGLVRILETRQGLTPARQRAVRDSRADWIAFVDDDCLLAPNWVAEAARFAAAEPGAGGFGGRVRPDWGRVPPAYLARHGWLFAEQERGAAICEVESLVGAGMVLNRRALGECGWAEHPFLADRVGLSHVSGGDVEICYRLTAAGRRLFFVPALRLDHLVAPGRQGLRDLARLARGLGAGAELLDLMGASDVEGWPRRAEARLRDEVRRHRASLAYVPTGRYAWQDWVIRAGFLFGRRAQLRLLRNDPAVRARLGGVWAR